jgi:hypothetical protein
MGSLFARTTRIAVVAVAATFFTARAEAVPLDINIVFQIASADNVLMTMNLHSTFTDAAVFVDHDRNTPSRYSLFQLEREQIDLSIRDENGIRRFTRPFYPELTISVTNEGLAQFSMAGFWFNSSPRDPHPRIFFSDLRATFDSALITRDGNGLLQPFAFTAADANWSPFVSSSSTMTGLPEGYGFRLVEGSATPMNVPEPTTALLLGLGLAAAYARHRRK